MRLFHLFLVFLRLGLTSFGGPIAHIAYFRQAFVVEKKWLSETDYAELVSLCHFLPGPSSSQVGFAIGMSRSGLSGAIAAWLGFTLPSACLMILFAIGISHSDVVPAGFLSGLKVVVVAVVAQAIWGMRTLCPSLGHIILMLISVVFLILAPSSISQLIVIAGTGLVGTLIFKHASQHNKPEAFPFDIKRSFGIGCLLMFTVLFLALPLISQQTNHPFWDILDSFYRAGSLVFGGGHVVLPLLESEVVHSGWVEKERFIAGYGAAQAIPGPLFTFAGYLGASMDTQTQPWLLGLACLVIIFLPSFLLLIGILPFWSQLRKNHWVLAALSGVNAGVVALLMAAFYQPVFSDSIKQPIDLAMAILAFVCLMFCRWPPWLVVIGFGCLGWVIFP